MKKTFIFLFVSALLLSGFLSDSFINTAKAEAPEDIWIYGVITEINPFKKKINVYSERFRENHELKVSQKDLSQIDKGDEVEIYFSETTGVLSLDKL